MNAKHLNILALTLLTALTVSLFIIALPKINQEYQERDKEQIHRNNLCIKAGYASYQNIYSITQAPEYKLYINNTKAYILYIRCNHIEIENGILIDDTRLILYKEQP